MSLNYEQLRVLYSLEKLILEDDIYITEKHSSKKLKLEWAKAWVDKLIENLSIAQSEKDEFFLSEEELGRRFQDNVNKTWVSWYLWRQVSLDLITQYSVMIRTRALKSFKIRANI